MDEVIELHTDQITRYGGLDGIRDRGLLESAVSQPLAMFGGQFLHEDVFKMAAAYLFHLVMNHPFLDGNKRAGLASTMTFLMLNGIELKVDVLRVEDMVRDVAQGLLDKEGIAKFLRANVT